MLGMGGYWGDGGSMGEYGCGWVGLMRVSMGSMSMFDGLYAIFLWSMGGGGLGGGCGGWLMI